MGNGAHEVFILMEFCAGGGIIDMMNRRLRERLTESEILTIFVNVCEVSPRFTFMSILAPKSSAFKGASLYAQPQTTPAPPGP